MINTKGIIVSKLKYRETSIIVKIFTKDLGIKSFLVPNVRTQKPKFNSEIFLSLNVVDLIFNNHAKNKLLYISEIKNNYSIFKKKKKGPNSNKNIEIGLFSSIISDLLDKTIKENVIYEDIFGFLIQNIISLNESEKGDTLFFLVDFMINFTKYLGFGITELEEINDQIKSIDRIYNFNDIEKKNNNKYFK